LHKIGSGARGVFEVAAGDRFLRCSADPGDDPSAERWQINSTVRVIS
jgi:hypothetical protein